MIKANLKIRTNNGSYSIIIGSNLLKLIPFLFKIFDNLSKKLEPIMIE